MREVVHVHVGQCGNALGTNVWELVAVDHGIEPDGSQRATMGVQAEEQLRGAGVFFDEASPGRFRPRAVLVDLDPDIDATLLLNPFWQCLARPGDNLLLGSQPAGNNWARGHYTEGADLVDSVLDAVRRQAEACDFLQGFQTVHSLGGGTGSGLGALLLQNIRDEYPDRVLLANAVFPSPKVSDTVVEPYNACLALHHLVQHADLVVGIDNEALFQNIQIQKIQKIESVPKPTYGDLNHLASTVLSGITTGMRFPHLGQSQSDLRKLVAHLRPSSLGCCGPASVLRFAVPGGYPVLGQGGTGAVNVTAEELFSHVLSGNAILRCPCEALHVRHLAATATFRCVSSCAVAQLSSDARASPLFVGAHPGQPDLFSASACPIPRRGHRLSCSVLANSTAILEPVERVLAAFSLLYRRKAFLKWYIGEGMDEMEFIEAQANLQDVTDAYRQFEVAKPTKSAQATGRT